MALFVGIAAALSVVSLQVGLIALRFAGRHGSAGLYAALGLAALIGALAYGLSLRLLQMSELSVSALAIISGGCVVAVYVAFFMLAHLPGLGRWWLAVFWWYAFSAGLWYCERRQYGE